MSLGTSTRVCIWCLICVVSGWGSTYCEAQSTQFESNASGNTTNIPSSEPAETSPDPVNSTQAVLNPYKNGVGLDLMKNFASDQRSIWTSPARLRLADA